MRPVIRGLLLLMCMGAISCGGGGSSPAPAPTQANWDQASWDQASWQ